MPKSRTGSGRKTRRRAVHCARVESGRITCVRHWLASRIDPIGSAGYSGTQVPPILRTDEEFCRQAGTTRTVTAIIHFKHYEERMGFFRSLFTARKRKNQMIEWAIETLGREGSAMGTAYEEISYADVVKYMRGRNCNPLNSIKNPANGWIDFEAVVKGKKYVVTLRRTFDGGGSVLTSARTGNP